MTPEAIRRSIEAAPNPQLAALRFIAQYDEIDDAYICELMDVERLGDIPTSQKPPDNRGLLPSVKHRCLALIRMGVPTKDAAAAVGAAYSTARQWVRTARKEAAR